MARVFRGIDIAGDQSEGSGVADLVERDGRLEVRVSDECFSGFDGIGSMCRVGAGEVIVSCGVDQPLGFPYLTLRLLNGEGLAAEVSSRAELFRYRNADRAMRAWLAGRGLNPDFVRPPIVCDNVWRALHLLAIAGQSVAAARGGMSCWFETHPRLSIAELVPGAEQEIVTLYKAKLPRARDDEGGRKRELAIRHRDHARLRLLELVQSKLPLLHIADDTRAAVIADDNKLEALFCALAAYAKPLGIARRFPTEDLSPEVAGTEGYVYTLLWSNVAAAARSGK